MTGLAVRAAVALYLVASLAGEGFSSRGAGGQATPPSPGRSDVAKATKYPYAARIPVSWCSRQNLA